MGAKAQGRGASESQPAVRWKGLEGWRRERERACVRDKESKVGKPVWIGKPPTTPGSVTSSCSDKRHGMGHSVGLSCVLGDPTSTKIPLPVRDRPARTEKRELLSPLSERQTRQVNLGLGGTHPLSVAASVCFRAGQEAAPAVTKQSCALNATQPPRSVSPSMPQSASQKNSTKQSDAHTVVCALRCSILGQNVKVPASAHGKTTTD